MMINKKINTYKINPADGEALLNYKGRISSDDLYMQVYSIDKSKSELVNTTESNEATDGVVFDGDCLSVCAYLKENDKTVDMVYIDPPFASNANYSKKIHLRNKTKLKKDYSLELADNTIGEEIMYGDIWNKEDYLNWLYVRLVAIREILSSSGCIFVHLDWHIGNYVKVMMDEIFGEENFRNEIIWSYRSGGASKKESLARKHDSIYFYSKTSDFEINQLTERQYLEKAFMDSKQDEDGRYYSDTILRDVLEGIISIVNPDGTIDEYNVRPVLNLSSERTDYNTQKPEGLLKLLIRLATKDGDIVADFFGGSGTTASSSYATNRKFITCDVGKNSIQNIRDRLREAGAKFEILDIKDGLDLFRNPTQTIKKLFELCSGERRTSDSEYSTLWDGVIPYNKKMLYAKVVDNRKVIDENYIDYLITETSQDYINDEQSEYLVLYIYKDNDITEEIVNKKIKKSGMDFKINFVSIESLLKEKLNALNTPDSVKYNVEKVDGKKYKVTIKNYFSPYLKGKIDEENLRRVKKANSKQVEISDNGYELIELVSFDTKLKEEWCSVVEDKSEDFSTQIEGSYILKTDKFKMKIRNIAGDEIIIDHTGESNG